MCTTLSDKLSIGRSCGKIVFGNVYLQNRPNNVEKVHAILDDQSNRTLIFPTLCDPLQGQGPVTQYSLSSCSGTTLSCLEQGLTAHVFNQCVKIISVNFA